MNQSQIQSAMELSFEHDAHRIVFWNDPEGSFGGEIKAIAKKKKKKKKGDS